MPNRLPAALSVCALAVAILGWTPLGEAAREAAFPANSVGTTQLKANAVVSSKIRNGSVQAIDIQKRAITNAHVKPGSLLGSAFRAGQLPAGPKGDKGDRGDRGPRGFTGLSEYQIVQTPVKTVAPNTTGVSRAACPVGKVPIGGGGHMAGSGSSRAYLTSSIPIEPREWQAGFRNVGPDTISMWAYAVCAVVET